MGDASVLFPKSNAPSETVQNWIEQYLTLRTQLTKWRYCGSGSRLLAFHNGGPCRFQAGWSSDTVMGFVGVHPLSAVVFISYLSFSLTKMKIRRSL